MQIAHAIMACRMSSIPRQQGHVLSRMQTTSALPTPACVCTSGSSGSSSGGRRHSSVRRRYRRAMASRLAGAAQKAALPAPCRWLISKAGLRGPSSGWRPRTQEFTRLKASAVVETETLRLTLQPQLLPSMVSRSPDSRRELAGRWRIMMAAPVAKAATAMHPPTRQATQIAAQSPSTSAASAASRRSWSCAPV